MNRSAPAVDAALAAELVELRRVAGLGQRAIAMRLGIAVSDVDRSEAGQRSVNVIELFNWCQACGSSLASFMERLDRRLTKDVYTTRQ